MSVEEEAFRFLGSSLACLSALSVSVLFEDSAVDTVVEGCSMMGSDVSVFGAISNAGRAGTLTSSSDDAMIVYYMNTDESDSTVELQWLMRRHRYLIALF